MSAVFDELGGQDGNNDDHDSRDESVAEKSTNSLEEFLSEPSMVAVANLVYTPRDTNHASLMSLAASLRQCQLHDVIIGPPNEIGESDVFSGSRRTAAARAAGIMYLRCRIFRGPHRATLSVAANAQCKSEKPRSLLMRLREDFAKKGTDKKTVLEIKQLLGAETGIKKTAIYYLAVGALLDEADYQKVLASENVLKAVRELREKSKASSSNSRKKGKVKPPDEKHRTYEATEQTPASNHREIDSLPSESTPTSIELANGAAESAGKNSDIGQTAPSDFASATGQAPEAAEQWFIAHQIQITLAEIAVTSEEKELAGPWILTLARPVTLTRPIGSRITPINCGLVARAATILARRITG